MTRNSQIYTDFFVRVQDGIGSNIIRVLNVDKFLYFFHRNTFLVFFPCFIQNQLHKFVHL
jgi:hypothetical protein